MRRDDDLIRSLLLDLEVANDHVNDSHAVPGYMRDQIAYHLALIVKAGYAEGPQPRYSSTGSDPTIPIGVLVTLLRQQAMTSLPPFATTRFGPR